MKIEIKNRWTDAVIFSHECEGNTMRITVEAAVAAGASLDGASLNYTSLNGANLTPIRDDIWAVLSSAPLEVPALIKAIKAGRVDGSTYSGECSCLVGTIGRARGKSVDDLGSLKPNSSRPAERFFMGIIQGDAPETSQFSALALEWSQEWLDAMTAAFAPKAA